MKVVRMRTTYAGPSGTCPIGKLIRLSDDEAKELVEKGYAEYSRPQKVATPEPEPEPDDEFEEVVETATEEQVGEVADDPRPRKKRRRRT